jgi:hypothetical protein
MSAVSRRVSLGFLLAAVAWPVAAAGAAGPPLPSSYSGREGVAVPGGSERIVARRAGPETVLVARDRETGTVLRSRRLTGRWSIPPVTIAGGTTGLSADGRTLVLARPTHTFPPLRTRLAVVDARTFTVRREIGLRGFFTVDAIAPDGGAVFLLQYPSQDFLQYRVRALDTATGGLDPHDVVDPREPDEQMGGLPMTRATGPGGRWVYTLYGGGTETFIHALDTVGRTAACIDLEMLPPDGDFEHVALRLNADGSRLHVRDAGRVVAIVDTQTFAVREPGEAAEAEAGPTPAPATAPASARAEVDDGSLLLPLAIGGGLLLLAAGLIASRHRGVPG